MNKLSKVIKIFLFVSLFFIMKPVYALNYNNSSDRLSRNTSVQTTLNNFSDMSKTGYSDKRLIDLPETNYKGLSNTEGIESLANEILGANKESLTSLEKLSKFYDFVKDNFYYYSGVNTLPSLSNNYSNPEYLLEVEYKSTGKIRANSNGYVAFLSALARSEDMPTVIMLGYYYNGSYWQNSAWLEAYIGDRWVIMDPISDCSNKYSDLYNYEEGIEKHKNSFDMSIDTLSKDHMASSYYKRLKNAFYVSNTSEINQYKTILLYSNNGQKINPSFDKNDSYTWFSENTKTTNDGYGNFDKLYLKGSKELTGKLTFKNFKSLNYLNVSNNKFTTLTVSNCPKLATIYANNNSISKIVVNSGTKLVTLNALSNKSNYVEYRFGSKKRKAVIKAGVGGYVSVKYVKSGGKYRHTMKAAAKSGYAFKGWYRNGKKVSTKSTRTMLLTKSFTYTAKFRKRTYIKVSISSQKIWFYKDGKLIVSSSVVTGHKGLHNTPKGTFKILNKARNATLKGDDYESFVYYWMPITYSGIGLHDATWRSSFGGTIYKYNGSHGCINLPYSVAQKIYKYAKVGTTVYIV